MPDEREKREGTEPDEAIREATKPDPGGAGEAMADAIRPPDYRTRKRSPSTSERRLRRDELPGSDESTQG